LTRNFWRGVIAGSVLAAVMTMLRKPQRKPELPGMDRVKRMRPRRAADKMLKGVARTVDGLIKKR